MELTRTRWLARLVPVDALCLLGRYLSVSIRSQMQYRASFLLSALGQFLITGIEFVGVWALFARFGRLGDWTLREVALFYGAVNVAFALADALSTGFDQFASMVRRGDFDRLLVRPRSPVLQLAGQELALRRVGRLAQGGAILVWAMAGLELDWSVSKFLLLMFAIGGAVCLFFGLIVVQATLCFWTTESLEIVNTMTYGGVQAAQYPLAVYGLWLRRLFTVIVPLACVAYFPLVAVLGRADPLGSPPWFQAISPLAGIVFLLLALWLWRFGVRRYTSTGS